MKQHGKLLKPSDFEIAWHEHLSPFLKKRITEAHLWYRELTSEERDVWLRKAIEFLVGQRAMYAGKHRRSQWENGWQENLREFKKKRDIVALDPHYFNKYPINRFRQRFIMALSENFERDILAVLEYWVFEKYLKNFPAVYEFGCGTGHNLLRLREMNKDVILWGLDWARSSQKLIRSVARYIHDPKLFARSFDLFHPDDRFILNKNGAIFTIAALEQTGMRYKKLIAYFLKQKPALCVHIEPTEETLDPNNLLDYLSIKYFEKRKYLSGFIAYLRDLEKKKKVKVINIQRSFIGSFYIDGYSIIVWKPLQ